MRSPIPLSELEPSCGPVDSTVALPPAVFTSPEFHEFDMEAVFGHEWFCIGRATDIPGKGDFFTINVGKEPLLVVRQADDSIRVLSNVCRHRAMKVAEGCGKARRFRCPYHSWVYGLDGALQSAPTLNDVPSFDPSAVSLPEIRSEIWEGFVFVTFDETLPPVSSRLENAAAYLANWGVAGLRSASPQTFMDIPVNWKLFGDECYHCSSLHAKSYHAMYDVSIEHIDYNSAINEPKRGIIAYEVLATGEDFSPTRTGRILQPPLPGLTSEQRSKVVFATIAPNMLIIAMPDKVKYFLWLPTGPTTSVFAATWMYPPSTLERPDFREKFEMEVTDLKPVMDEDIYAWKSVQAGLHSRHAPRGRYAPSEVVLVRLNEWLIDKYRRADAAAANGKAAGSYAD